MPGSPHFQFVSAPPPSATVTIDASIRTKAELLSTIARALHFPDCFGHSWDALVDSLSDLSFHAGTDATIDHASLPSLPDTELTTYLGCLSAALDQLHSREVECSGLRVVFRESDRARIVRAFADPSLPLSFHDGAIDRFVREGDALILEIEHALVSETTDAIGCLENGALRLIDVVRLLENGTSVPIPSLTGAYASILDLDIDLPLVRLLVEWQQFSPRHRQFAEYDITCASVTWTSRTAARSLDECLDSLLSQWMEHGTSIRLGATASTIAQFEQRHGIRLPPWFSALYQRANGFVDGAMDRQDVRVWPLDEIVPCGDDFFIFADYSHRAHHYALRLRGDRDNVFIVGGDVIRPLAPSFQRFLQRYADSP